MHIPEDLLERVQKSSGQDGEDTEIIQSALDHQQLALPPVVLTEILSDPALPRAVRTLLAGLPILDVEPGFWERAGLLRASVLKQKKKARVADALIAQNCLDQATPLVRPRRHREQPICVSCW